jgi:hypothetical protein
VEQEGNFWDKTRIHDELLIGDIIRE